MRIISGQFKGRRINPPKNLPVRPTTDLSKEALFNILNNIVNFDGIKVLDLFAGTGNISYEFYSRGTTNITCVDIDYNCIKFIKQISTLFNFDIAAIKSDVFTFITKSNSKYDIIFADPPYNFDQKFFEKIILNIFEKNLLINFGVMVIEHSTYTKLDHLPYFNFKKKYGGCVFSFFEMTKNDT